MRFNSHLRIVSQNVHCQLRIDTFFIWLVEKRVFLTLTDNNWEIAKNFLITDFLVPPSRPFLWFTWSQCNQNLYNLSLYNNDTPTWTLRSAPLVFVLEKIDCSFNVSVLQYVYICSLCYSCLPSPTFSFRKGGCNTGYNYI